MTFKIINADVLEGLRGIADGSVDCCVTSPPYWGLRDYGVAGQIGLEKTPEEFIARLAGVFREVRRTLADDGTLWVNMGDSYNSPGPSNHGKSKEVHRGTNDAGWVQGIKTKRVENLKPKDLCGIPWMLAFALRSDGWYLRQDIIWSKPNPMPESVTDRCTKAHEYLFMLTKSARYFYNADAIKEPMELSSIPRLVQDVASQTGSNRANGGAKTNGTMKAVGRVDKQRGHSRRHAGFNDRWDHMERAEQCSGMRNKRSVWSIATEPFKEAHFATYPTKLVEPCIRAGCRPGGVVLDPFTGSGTTGLVALREGRSFVGVELNPEYAEMARRRIENDCPLLNREVVA